MAQPGTRRDSGEPTPRRWLRFAGVVATAAAVAATAACTAGTAGGGVGGGSKGGAGSGSSSTATLTFADCCGMSDTITYNPYNSNGQVWPDWVTLRLALRKAPSLTDYVPQLAESWTMQGQDLVVKLHQGAKWQDGSPVTSKDVYDTAILDGTNGAAFWNDITAVKATDDSTVKFTLRPGQPVPLAENDILANLIVYPSSVYGKFVTSQLEKDVPAYYAKYRKDPTAASKMAAYDRIGDVFKKLSAMKVTKLIGDGPFQLKAMNSSEAVMNKWSGSWFADKIKVDKIDFKSGANQTVYPQLLSNTADFSNAYQPPTVLKSWLETSGAHVAVPEGYGFAIGINSNKYPLNLVKVRQALAYVMSREAMTQAAYGTGSNGGGAATKIITGLTPYQNKTYLTQQQLDSLNPYPVDTEKAAELLKSSGFTQKDGQWYTPKGKRFTLTFTVKSDTSDILTSFTSASRSLTKFGIKSSINAEDGARMATDLAAGDFDLGMYTPRNPLPLGMFSAMLHDNNFLSSGVSSGQRGIGFGPKAKVPGLGTVNVPSTIYSQTSNVGPGKKMNKLVWDWAQLVNQQLPYIYYGTKQYQYAYSTSRFSDWPKTSSQIWTMIVDNSSGGIAYALENGYIVPK